MDPAILHRIQFGLSVAIHFIFAPLSIGLITAIVIAKALHLATKKPLWDRVARFWTYFFGLTFAMGVATGIPLVFSFGTNWARFSHFVADTLGPVFVSEAVFAFALEASFFGLLMYGQNKLSSIAHFIVALCVATGAIASAFFIVAANSWMQTPGGVALVSHSPDSLIATMTSYEEVLFNKSTWSHFFHVLFASWLTGAFFMLAISAWYFLRKKHEKLATASFTLAALMAFTCTLGLLLNADMLGRNVAQNNPEKFAAFEGTYTTTPYTPAYLFGWPSDKNRTVYGPKIPGLMSILAFHDAAKPVPGLDSFPPEDLPVVPLVFSVYHLMVISWFAMFAASLIALWLLRKKRWQHHPKLLMLLTFSLFLPPLANLAGWCAAEFGRQPWVVYKLLKTQEAYSAHVTGGSTLFTLTSITLLYSALLIVYCYFSLKKVKEGP